MIFDVVSKPDYLTQSQMLLVGKREQLLKVVVYLIQFDKTVDKHDQSPILEITSSVKWVSFCACRHRRLHVHTYLYMHMSVCLLFMNLPAEM